MYKPFLLSTKHKAFPLVILAAFLIFFSKTPSVTAETILLKLLHPSTLSNLNFSVQYPTNPRNLPRIFILRSTNVVTSLKICCCCLGLDAFEQ